MSHGSHGGWREGAGRPPDTGTPRERRIDIPVSDQEHDELAAAAAGKPLATWIRERALAAARRRRTGGGL